MSLERIKRFASALEETNLNTAGSDIRELLEYKEYLERELEKVKAELRKKVQR
jgi:hypothetical protein